MSNPPRPSTKSQTPPPPTIGDYLDLSQSAYSLTTDNGKANASFTPPKGYTVLERSDPELLNEGFSAVALKSSSGNIVIAFEGTVPVPAKVKNHGVVTNPFSLGTLGTDSRLHSGQHADTLTDAGIFALNVARKYEGPVYVTGHSLGGTEAEEAASVLGKRFAGGMTFGATGLPQNMTAGPAATLINVVDHGDPVGHFATDQDHYGPKSMMHYGKVKLVGDDFNGENLRAAFKYEAADQKQSGLISRIRNLGGVVTNAAFSVDFHSIDHYREDLKSLLGDAAEKVMPFDPDKATVSHPQSPAATPNLRGRQNTRGG